MSEAKPQVSEGRPHARLARGRWYRKDQGSRGAPDLERDAAAEARAGRQPKSERALVCARCGHLITHERERIRVGDRHVHTQVNPHGYLWRFGCFSAAPGCRLQGEPTAEWTWFPGYLWELAYCGGCGLHLGWRFSAAAGRFFGLILENLVEAAGSAGDGRGSSP